VIDHRCIPSEPCVLCGRGGVRKPAATVRRSLPLVCAHLAAEPKTFQGLTGTWRKCNAGHGSTTPGVRAAHCCSCPTERPGGLVWRIGHECGPSCPGFSAPKAEPPPAPGHSVVIGPPPDLTPRSDRLVCTVAVGPSGEAMLKATGPLMQRYAAKVGADFLAITGDPLNPGYPLADKFRLHHLTPHYKRLLFVDADALIHPDAPDLFALVPRGVAIRDDAAEVGDRAYLAEAFRKTLASQGLPFAQDGGRVLNSGVVLWGRDTSDVWRPPPRPLPAGLHVAEQCWVHHSVLRYQMYALDRQWNYQWWTDRKLEGVGPARPWILHMAGLSQMAQVPGWHLGPSAVRSAVLIVAAWACQTRANEMSDL
jgi:hypothetical protein